MNIPHYSNPCFLQENYSGKIYEQQLVVIDRLAKALPKLPHRQRWSWGYDWLATASPKQPMPDGCESYLVLTEAQYLAVLVGLFVIPKDRQRCKPKPWNYFSEQSHIFGVAVEREIVFGEKLSDEDFKKIREDYRAQFRIKTLDFERGVINRNHIKEFLDERQARYLPGKDIRSLDEYMEFVKKQDEAHRRDNPWLYMKKPQKEP